MRIRYMTLPEEWDGERFKERFILILDKVDDAQRSEFRDTDKITKLKYATGAAAVLVLAEEIEIGDSQ